MVNICILYIRKFFVLNCLVSCILRFYQFFLKIRLYKTVTFLPICVMQTGLF